MWIKYLVNYQHQDLNQKPFGYWSNDCDHWAMSPQLNITQAVTTDRQMNRQMDEWTDSRQMDEWTHTADRWMMDEWIDR